LQLLERVPFLAALSDADRQWLAQRVRRRNYVRGDIVFQKDDPGEALFIVETGSVRIHVTGAQGTDLTLAVMNANDFFGDMSLLDGKPRSASASAVTDCVLIVLERDHFTELVRKRPDAALAVLARVTHRLRGSDQMASDLAFLDAGGRLARRLLEIAEQSGVTREDGVLLNVRITQEELANMIGVTRESVNRNLSEFRRLGLIRNEGRKIIIRDPAGLRAYLE
jgi:CRP/FNR family transcriptional regulator/CRP/FNR family cyclic AMP-dependent transcriptional regulator